MNTTILKKSLRLIFIGLNCAIYAFAQENPAITMVTDKAPGSEITVHLELFNYDITYMIDIPTGKYINYPDTFLIDCGDGILIKKPATQSNKITFITKGSTLKIYMSNPIFVMKFTCHDCKLTSLDISRCELLRDLYCYNNSLTSLDVSNNTYLRSLKCEFNKLTTLILSNNKDLQALDCEHNQLTELDVSNNRQLFSFDCDYNKLTTLKLSKNYDLQFLSCYHNELSELDVSKIKNIKTLGCSYNHLTKLDVSKNEYLSNLSCDNNQLAELDVSKNEDLKELFCGNNQLTELDVSKNEGLKILYCENNQLTELDIANNKDLSSLHCEKNRLTVLDVSWNKLLTELIYKGNLISFLDVSNNTVLKFDDEFYEQAWNKKTQLKLPDKEQAAKEAERRRREKEMNWTAVQAGFAVEGGYLAMPFTQRDKHTHFQNLWYLGADFLLTVSKYNREDSHIAFGGGIYSVPLPQKEKKVLPSVSICYTKENFYEGLNLDCKISASTYHINPSIGLNMLNFFKLHAGYSFSTRPFYYNTELKGFTIGINFSIGRNTFSQID